MNKPYAIALYLMTAVALPAQEPLLVADQTFKVTGEHEYIYAFAEGDRIDLHVEILGGRQLKVVELVQFPDHPVYRNFELDTVMDKSILIPKTAVYALRLKEAGVGKKVCRFTLHRTPASPTAPRIDTRVPWDIRQYPLYQERRRNIPNGVQTELVSLSGRVTVKGSKLGLGNPVNSFQFTLPPHTVRWAYRIAVGQQSTEARRKDAEQFTNMLKKGAVRMAGIQPESALAAFALGMAIDLTTSTAGEDVEYALVDAANQQRFLIGEPYKSPLWQGGVSVDIQRRYSPLEGTWYFAFKNNNWVDDIDVTIDIECVTEKPLFVEEIYLEPLRP